MTIIAVHTGGQLSLRTFRASPVSRMRMKKTGPLLDVNPRLACTQH